MNRSHVQLKNETHTNFCISFCGPITPMILYRYLNPITIGIKKEMVKSAIKITEFFSLLYQNLFLTVTLHRFTNSVIHMNTGRCVQISTIPHKYSPSPQLWFDVVMKKLQNPAQNTAK